MPLVVSGPAYLFVGVAGTPGGTTYIGSCERAPDLRVVPAYLPCMSDVTGRKLPAGWFSEGAEAFLRFDLTAWSASGLAICTSLDGGSGPMNIGAIRVFNESLTVSVLFGGGQPWPGITFYGCTLEDWTIFDTCTSAAHLSLVFHGIGVLRGKSFVLWDNQIVGLGVPPQF